jgi:hypothetical protein
VTVVNSLLPISAATDISLGQYPDPITRVVRGRLVLSSVSVFDMSLDLVDKGGSL